MMLQKRIKMEFSILEFIAREILSNNCTKGEVEIENVYSFRLKSKKKKYSSCERVILYQ